MKKNMLLVCLLICYAPLSALLPPLAQSVAELRSLFSNGEVSSYLDSAEPIQKISKNEKGYLIETASQQMQVDVLYRPSRKVGPAEFDLKFNTPTQKAHGRD